MAGWTNGHPFTVTESAIKGFTRHRKLFGCLLCGHQFAVGDSARFVYANGGSEFRYGNFFVCVDCDAGACDPSANPIVIRRVVALADEMKKHQELVNRLCNDRNER